MLRRKNVALRITYHKSAINICFHRGRAARGVGRARGVGVGLGAAVGFGAQTNCGTDI